MMATDPTAAPAPSTPAFGFRIADALGAGYSPQEITDFLQANPDQAQGFDIAGAIKAGYSPAEITDHLNPRADKINVQGIPVLAPLDRGIAHLREGVANLATDLGATNVGSYIRQSIPQATLAAPTSGAALSNDLASRHYLSALSNLPSAVLEQAAPVAGAVVAGAASGGSVPAALAAGAGIGAATQGDAIARQRAVNNGRAAPDASDLAIGLGSGAAVGAAGSFGLGGAGGGLANATRATLAHAAGDAVQPELTALAGSVGTAQGAQNAEPQDIAAAALTGLGTRGALAAPAVGRAAYDLTPTGRQGVLANQFAAMSPDQQSNVTNAAAAQSMLNAGRADAVPVPGGPASDASIARTVGDLLDRRIGGLASSLDAQGLVTASGSQAIGEAWKAAADPGRVLVKQHLDALDDAGLDPGTAETLKSALMQRAAISQAWVDPQTSTLGAVTGAVAGVVPRLAGKALHAMLPTPVAMMANAAFQPVVSALLTKAGLNTPTLQSAGTKGLELLQAAGQPIPDTIGGLTSAASAQQNVVTAQARLMGLDPRQSVVPADEAAAVQATQPPPGSPQAIAMARVDARAAQAPGGSLMDTVPGVDGISPEALKQGALLPEWQYGLGKSLADALTAQGTPKPLNFANEVSQAVQNMSDRGWFDRQFADTLMGHNGRVTRGLYNVIRNEMLMGHGIDRRTLAAQQQPTP